MYTRYKDTKNNQETNFPPKADQPWAGIQFLIINKYLSLFNKHFDY